MRNETNFKLGDNVFDIRRGWGIVIGIGSLNLDRYPVIVKFPNKNDGEFSYTFDGRDYNDSIQTLSFNEYKFDGFSQERPEVLPEVGDVVWVRDSDTNRWQVSHFMKKNARGYLVSQGCRYNDPITWENWNCITTENPYKK